MAPHRPRKDVVYLARQVHRLGRPELLHARGSQRQHLHVHAGGVHRRDPTLAEVAQPLDEPGEARRDLGVGPGGLRLLLQPAPRPFHERLGGVVLLQPDRPHRPPPQLI